LSGAGIHHIEEKGNSYPSLAYDKYRFFTVETDSEVIK
jgi:hypothetical protein